MQAPATPSPGVQLEQTSSADLPPPQIPQVPQSTPTKTPDLQRPATELEKRAGEIRDLLGKVRHGEDEETTRCYVQTLLLDSVATILDLTGQSADATSGKVHSQPENQHFFVLNGREYRFSRGEFPEFDAFVTLTSDQIDWRGRVDRKEKDLGPRPTFTDELITGIETRANEVLGMIDPVRPRIPAPR